MRKNRIKTNEQIYDHYSEEDFSVWKLLYETQINSLYGIVAEEFLKGLEILDFNSKKILHENLEIKQAIKAYNKAAELSSSQQTISSNPPKSSISLKGDDLTQQILDLKTRISDLFTSPHQRTLVEPPHISSPENEALKILGLPSNATPAQIKMRYKQLAKKISSRFSRFR